MIEKLKYIEYRTGGEDMVLRIEKRVAQPWEMQDKINELVDAINALIKENNIHEKQIDELQMKVELAENGNFAKNAQDQFAEQRKWIGTLCRCWDSDINDDIWGILQDIKDNKTEKYYLYGIGYEHCEPVKPDDDIIYKDK